VVTFTGQDDETTAPAAMRAWAALSPAPLRQHAYPGGHFFLQTARDLVLADLRTEIDRVLGARTGAGGGHR
jgi:medium-chain acyl-[acyl-carrier-protein] hydrolase